MLEKFQYTAAESGVKIALPKFKHLPVGLVRKARGLSQVEQIFTVVEAVADEKTLAEIDKLTTEEFNAFVAEWQKDSGVTQGESTASAAS